MPSWLIFLLIGLFAGVASGLFGVGGGIVIVPALVYVAGFTQHMATGTSLAVLLPPIGLAATLEFYRHGNVNIAAAIIIAAGVFLGAYVGSYLAHKVAGPQLRLAFGIFLCCLSIYLIYGAARRLGWI